MKLFYRLIAFALLLFVSRYLYAQQLTHLHPAIEQYRLSKKDIAEFKELLAIPNVSSDKINIRKNIDYCDFIFKKRKFQVTELITNNQPFLLAERIWNRNINKTVLIYLQLDGQPVTPDAWKQENPFKPVLKTKRENTWLTVNEDTLTNYPDEMRIFARSASDAKGPVMMFLKAIDIIDSLHLAPDYNIKVIMDFEEEVGSPNIQELIKQHREKLKADFLLVYDGPLHSSNTPTLIFGARGVSLLNLTFWGPKTDLHSGHFGNFIPNPAFQMAQLLSAMKDRSGKVLIPGFYKDVRLTTTELKLITNKYDDEQEMLKRHGINRSEKIAVNYQSALQYPSFNITGIKVAETGKDARTIIPSKAIAEFDIRTVLTTDTLHLTERIKTFIRSKGYHIIYSGPSEDDRLKYPHIVTYQYKNFYPPFRTKLSHPVSNQLIALFKKISVKEPVFIPITGGSVPIAPFVNHLNIPAVIVPTVNADNNQHAADENLRLGNFLYGIKLFSTLLLEKF